MDRRDRAPLHAGIVLGIQGFLAASISLNLATGAVGQCRPVELLASDPNQAAQFGRGVALSDDATIALVGANQSGGYAYIFADGREGWAEMTMISGFDTAGDDFFGDAVALSGDGTTALVSAPGHQHTEFIGAAYIFVRERSSWVQQMELTPPDDPDPPVAFGATRGVALSNDGDTAAIGAWKDNDGAEWAGAVYVFERDTNTSEWTFQAKLIVSDPAEGAQFGESVALSADGNILVGGAHQDDEAGPASGAAYVFVRDPKSSQWTERIKLTASDAEPIALFGYSVAIAANGDTILVGADDDDEQGVGAGAAYVFVRDGNDWFEQAKLTASDGSSIDHFGSFVALSADGDRAVIGAVHATAGLGAAYFFTRTGSSWTQKSKFGVCDGESLDLFGERVDISGDGQTALVGSRWRDIDFISQGAAYVYDLDPASCADITGDGQVGVDDLLWLLGSWGPCTWPYVCPADLNGDCVIGVVDLLILLGSWG